MKYDWRVAGTPVAKRVVDASGKEWTDVVAVDTDTGILTRKVQATEDTTVVVDSGEAEVVDIAVPSPVAVEFEETTKPHKPHKAPKTKHAKDEDVKDDEE